MPIPSLLPQRASRFLLFVFSAAQAHTNPYSLSLAHERMPIPYFFVLRNSLTYAPAEAKVSVGLGPERTRPDRYQ